MKLNGLAYRWQREEIFKLIDCYQDSPVYREVEMIYETLKDQVEQLIEPAGLFTFGHLEAATATAQYPAGTPVIYLLVTIGGKISELSNQLFNQGEYLKGMLVDAMADSILFSMEPFWQDTLIKECQQHQRGIHKRLEAPEHLPVEVHREAFEKLSAGEGLQMKLSSGLMFDPVKTLCHVFVLTDDHQEFLVHHDCSKCSRLECQMRRIPTVLISVNEVGHQFSFELKEKESIMDGLKRSGSYQSAVCGGRGTCGKCRIRLLDGELDITASDRAFFSEAELNSGYRLSCQSYPLKNCTISLSRNREDDVQVVSTYMAQTPPLSVESKALVLAQRGYGIAIDLGTTTLATHLIEIGSGTVIASYTSVNHQRTDGADVIARIMSATHGRATQLRTSIQQDLSTAIKAVVAQGEIQPEQVQQVAIGANTTMGHLLLGLSCETLGVYPFKAVDLSYRSDPYQQVFADQFLDCPVLLIPGISVFVGGDVTAGLLCCNFDQTKQINLLVDLGTNGEMAIGNQDRILTTSVAAGPAFEGGNISCGVASVPGAICQVSLDQQYRPHLRTIGEQSPIGLCGTGVMEITAELLRTNLIDETGLLNEMYVDEGFMLAVTPEGGEIKFTQKDIREIQMAKAAVRAGIELLIQRYGCSYEQIEHVYLAGGFGFKLDQQKAVAIGMIPQELEHKIKAIGNSSLAGAIVCLRDESRQQRLEQLTTRSTEISLSMDPEFNDRYMKYMYF